jgi:hypothetical protein
MLTIALKRQKKINSEDIYTKNKDIWESIITNTKEDKK